MKLAAVILLAAGVALAQRPMSRGGGPRGNRLAGNNRYITPPPVAHPVHGAAIIVPYPVYYGAGYYGYDPTIPLTAQSAPAYDSDPANYAAAGQTPVVIINQGYRPDTTNPMIRDYSDTPLPPSAIQTYDATTAVVRDGQPTIYLIALQDHSIVAAIGYWVDRDILNYITQDGNQNRVSMELVDRDFSKQLNDERHVEFKLPRQN